MRPSPRPSRTASALRTHRLSLLLPVVLAWSGCAPDSASAPADAPDESYAGSGIRELLAQGTPVFGQFSGPQTRLQGAAMMVASDADFILYSMESGPFDVAAMGEYLAGMQETGGAEALHELPVLLRVPPIDDEAATADQLTRALPTGIAGIVFPHVARPDQAEASARLLAGGEPGEAPLNVLIVEDQEGIANADAIVRTPGLDVVFAGPGDLRRAYEGDMEAVEAAIQTVLAACKAHDVTCGITAGVDDMAMRLEEGWGMIIVTDPAAVEVGLELSGRAEDPMSAPRPIAALESVWLEELTWMEVRDLLAQGTTTAIIPTGGVEQNGPYVALGKHNYVLESACEMLALQLGNALCAPVVKLVPEGDIDEPSGHMRYPGTLSVRQETFEMMLTDVARSLEAHGFTDIAFIGDSGGNQRGMARVAEALNGMWDGARAHYVPEFYDVDPMIQYMNEELGIEETRDDGYHDFYWITVQQMVTDPATVRYHERVAAGLAHINGVSIEPVDEAVEVGRKLLQFRVDRTVEALASSLPAGSSGPR